MNMTLSKKEIWRKSVSPFARFMFGVRVFVFYLGFVCYCFMGLAFIGLFSIGLDDYVKKIGSGEITDDRFSMLSMPEIRSSFAISKALFVLLCLLVLVLYLAMLLWYQIGKSRFVATCIFIASSLIFVDFLISLCFVYSNTIMLTIRLFIMILVSVSDFVIMRGTYQYHRTLANARFKEEDRIRRAAEKTRRTEQFQITKPKLEHVYYPMKDSQKADANTIKIDQYLNDKSVERGSIYRDMSSSGESSSSVKSKNSENREQKDQKQAARIVKEQPIDLSDNPGTGSKYDFERRPLLSEIKESNKKTAKDEPMKVSQIDETASVAENKFSDIPVEKEIEYSEEVVCDADDLEPKINEETAIDTKVVENYEEGENGFKVDTSLGYRRITFDDM